MIRNWDNHLIAWAIELDGAPFEWGTVDCLSAALTAAAFMGIDPPDLGEWDDQHSFSYAVKAAGGARTLLESFASRVGLRRLRTGDLVYTPDGDTDTGLGAIAVVVRDRLLVVSSEFGARLIPLQFRDGAEGWRFDVD